jgi:hypothetical protein
VAFDVEGVAKLLDLHHQRATYGAVAEYLGQPARSLMADVPKRRLYSWIVSAQTGEPTKYPASAIHPDLFENDAVLSSGGELGDWIRSRP